MKKKLPQMGLTTFSDLETGEIRTIDTSSTKLQEDLEKTSRTRITDNKQLMDKLGAGFCLIDTSLSYSMQLRKFFLLRQKRRQ